MKYCSHVCCLSSMATDSIAIQNSWGAAPSLNSEARLKSWNSRQNGLARLARNSIPFSGSRDARMSLTSPLHRPCL